VKRNRGIELYAPKSDFEALAYAACFSISASENTRKAYWTDFRHWQAFCVARNVDPKSPGEVPVIAWVEDMRKKGVAPKTRARRIAGLCSVYRLLRKQRHVTSNPFSLEDGPDRERAVPLEPTPVASPEHVRKLLATCDDTTPEGRRDAAMIRVLWGTGARRGSLLAMTLERLRKDGPNYVASLVAKGNKEVRVLIRGKAAEALAKWLADLREGKMSTGPIWRKRNAQPMDERSFARMIQRRARTAGVTDVISPHMFRVAFLTYNPAGLESKQDAAGHADPATTRMYDRTSWRGREAFERMPEVEDTEEI
jgi:integrase/recombinase XerD